MKKVREYLEVLVEIREACEVPSGTDLAGYCRATREELDHMTALLSSKVVGLPPEVGAIFFLGAEGAQIPESVARSFQAAHPERKLVVVVVPDGINVSFARGDMIAEGRRVATEAWTRLGLARGLLLDFWGLGLEFKDEALAERLADVLSRSAAPLDGWPDWLVEPGPEVPT